MISASPPPFECRGRMHWHRRASGRAHALRIVHAGADDVPAREQRGNFYRRVQASQLEVHGSGNGGYRCLGRCIERGLRHGIQTAVTGCGIDDLGFDILRNQARHEGFDTVHDASHIDIEAPKPLVHADIAVIVSRGSTPALLKSKWTAP